MKFFYLFVFSFSSFAIAQHDYFTPEVKKEGLQYYKNRIYRGCSDLKEKQDPVSPAEMKKLVASASEIVEENFSRSFAENPKIKESFKKDMSELAQDPSCQREANDCRARVIGLSIYYYHQMRADIPDCQNYVKTPPMEKGYNKQCEIELKYRKSSLQGVHNTNYGMPGPGTYKKELVALKNNTTIELFNKIMHKDRINLHICNPVRSGVVFSYNLDIDFEGDYLEGIDPNYVAPKVVPKECVEEITTLYSEFIPTSFDEGRSTVGQDQVEPIKRKIQNFITSNPNMVITDVSVISSSSKTPFHIGTGKNKKIDPNSDEKNLSLAKDRAGFAEKVLNEIKASNSALSKVNFQTKAELAGPDFEAMDYNDRFVTRMTPGYTERVQALFKKNQKLFEEQALKKSATDLMDEKQFPTLYQAKYKPFQGFRINIKGFNEEISKCGSSPAGSSKSGQGGASKQ